MGSNQSGRPGSVYAKRVSTGDLSRLFPPSTAATASRLWGHTDQIKGNVRARERLTTRLAIRQVIDARRWPDTIVAVYLSRRVTSRIASQRRQRGNHGQVSLGPLHSDGGETVIRAGRVEVSTWRGRNEITRYSPPLPHHCHRIRQTDAALTITLSYRLPLVIDANAGPLQILIPTFQWRTVCVR